MLSALADSLYIIYQIRLIVKGFSESFLKKFSSKNAHKLLVEGLAAASAAGQPDYYSKLSYFCQWGFSVFLTNFEGGFWVRCILRTKGSTTTKCGCGGVKTPPYRRAGTERLPDKERYPQGCPSSGPARPPSPAGEGSGAEGASPLPTGGRGRKDYPVKGSIREVAPHPALRGHLPPQGKAWGRTEQSPAPTGVAADSQAL